MQKIYKNLICFIPAKSKSSRIKNKNLKKLNNKTLVEITINKAKSSNLFSNKDIVLSSDSKSILKIGKKLRIKTLLRSKKNSGDFSTTDSAILEALNNLDKKIKGIFILQVTSPLRKVNTIKEFVKYCIKKKLNHCLTVSKSYENISFFSKKYFNSLNSKRVRTQDRKPFLYENSLIYFVSTKFFRKNKKIYPKRNWNFFITDKYESLDINDKLDYEIVKKISKL